MPAPSRRASARIGIDRERLVHLFERLLQAPVADVERGQANLQRGVGGIVLDRLGVILERLFAVAFIHRELGLQERAHRARIGGTSTAGAPPKGLSPPTLTVRTGSGLALMIWVQPRNAIEAAASAMVARVLKNLMIETDFRGSFSIGAAPRYSISYARCPATLQPFADLCASITL